MNRYRRKPSSAPNAASRTRIKSGQRNARRGVGSTKVATWISLRTHSRPKKISMNKIRKTDNAYTCPMHPEVVQDKPGMCPECGMNLIPAKNKAAHLEHDGHDKHAGHKTSSFLAKFWIAFALTIPIFFYSEMASMVFKI